MLDLSFVEYFIIIIMIIIIVFYIKKYYGEVDYVKSSIDDRYYLVRKLSDKQKAADFLADINKECQKLIKHLVTKYPENPDIIRLKENYDPESVSEGSSENGYTSYSVNKGEKIILCLRQKDTNELVPKNVILYVTIHELAHLMTSEVGHTKTFWNNFKFILQEAVDIGIYNKTDYSKEPAKYCGIKITSSVI
jgi:predicted metal-dependent hydrolase